MKFKILLVVVVVLIAIQLVPFGRNHTNPAVQAEPAWDSPATRALFFRACGDCHSNETKWPWYSSLAPISWLVRHDVVEGREHLNVSEWGRRAENKGNEAAEEVEDGEMPPWVFLIAHPEARLSDQETTALVSGLVKTFGRKKHH